MNRTALIVVLSLFVSGLATAQESISLDGEWDFSVPGRMDGPVKVTVPHTYNVMDGLENYAGKAVYSRVLPVSESMKGKQVRICFNAVYHDARVYVNGIPAGEHLDAGYTPFSFNITDHLRFDGSDEVRVDCDNSFSKTNLPCDHMFDWANDGGIYRSVSLHTSGALSIRYSHVTPQIDLSDSTATACFAIKLYEQKVRKARFELRITENATGREVFGGSEMLKSGADGIFRYSAPCGKVRLWHFDDPNLYTFELRIFDKSGLSDVRRESFGFRTFTVEGGHFVLNGEPVRLPGLENMPGSNPAFGMAESPEYMLKTLKRMKDLGCTITRYHWVQDDERLHIADSLGILVQEEISWWGGPSGPLDPALRETALRQVAEMVEAHYNHPSVWAWGMSNEVADNTEDILLMRDVVRTMDTTRVVNAISNGLHCRHESDPAMALDLPTWNEYTDTWYGRPREQLAIFLEELRPVLSGRPLFITEYGLCEPAHTGGEVRRMDDMLYHIKEWQNHPEICGYIYFCLEDYRTHMGEEGLGRNRIRRHGVCSKTLEPKSSYYLLQGIMCPLQVIDIKPAGDAGTDMKIKLRVKDSIPSYILRGYHVSYADASGKSVKIDLPDLAPGTEYTIIAPAINESYNFEVCRADGSRVLSY